MPVHFISTFCWGSWTERSQLKLDPHPLLGGWTGSSLLASVRAAALRKRKVYLRRETTAGAHRQLAFPSEPAFSCASLGVPASAHRASTTPPRFSSLPPTAPLSQFPFTTLPPACAPGLRWCSPQYLIVRACVLVFLPHLGCKLRNEGTLDRAHSRVFGTDRNCREEQVWEGP